MTYGCDQTNIESPETLIQGAHQKQAKPNTTKPILFTGTVVTTTHDRRGKRHLQYVTTHGIYIFLIFVCKTKQNFFSMVHCIIIFKKVYYDCSEVAFDIFHIFQVIYQQKEYNDYLEQWGKGRNFKIVLSYRVVIVYP